MNPFSMGNAFNEAKAFIMQNPVIYVAILILMQIVGVIVMFLPLGGAAGIQLLTGGASDPQVMAQVMAGAGALLIITYILGIAITISGQFAVWRHGLMNGSVSWGEALVYGVKASLPVLLFSLVVGIIFLIVAFIGVFLFGGIGIATGASSPESISASIIMLFVFMLALLFGALYFYARFCLMGPDMADNNSLNPFAAAGRSWNATQGKGWMIALFVFLCYVVFAVIYLVVGAIAGALASSGGTVGTILTLIIMLPIFAIGALMGVGLPVGIYRDVVGRADKTEIFN